MTERLRRIDNYPKYLVSNKGYIISFCRGRRRVLKPNISNSGYSYINLTNPDGHRCFLIARLVAIAFIPNPKSLLEVNHKDANKLNNDVSNLEWCTRSHNVRHAFELGLNYPPNVTGSLNGRAKLSEEDIPIIRELLKRKVSQPMIAKRFGVSRSIINHISTGLTWKHVAEVI